MSISLDVVSVLPVEVLASFAGAGWPGLRHMTQVWTSVQDECPNVPVCGNIKLRTPCRPC